VFIVVAFRRQSALLTDTETIPSETGNVLMFPAAGLDQTPASPWSGPPGSEPARIDLQGYPRLGEGNELDGEQEFSESQYVFADIEESRQGFLM
jgi:hypothetical protein